MKRFWMSRESRQRIRAAVMAVMVLAAFFFLTLAIAFEADHECPGAGCEICARITACAETLRSFAVLAAAAAAFTFTAAFVPLSAKLPRISFRESLVTLKVKLSD